jgi:hypothetical protein
MQDSSILDQTRGKQIFGPELIQEAEEQVYIIQKKFEGSSDQTKELCG